MSSSLLSVEASFSSSPVEHPTPERCLVGCWHSRHLVGPGLPGVEPDRGGPHKGASRPVRVRARATATGADGADGIRMALRPVGAVSGSELVEKDESQ